MKKNCERYPTHVQNSVFEGNITEGKLNMLKKQLRKVIDTDYDQCSYKLDSMKYTSKEEIGSVHTANNTL